MLIRRIVLLLGATAIAASAAAGGAAAQPTTPASPGSGPGVVSSTSLPENFPADLKQFVGGTEEFKNGEWFTGACQDRGGDMGAYLGAMLTNENRLMWWSLPDDGKKALLLASSGALLDPTMKAKLEPVADQMIRDGQEPDADTMPRVFPAGDANFHPPKGMCADDLKAWASSSSNTWGFDWTAPDTSSLRAAEKGEGRNVPEKAWTDACSDDALGIYCAHSFFVNCTKADGKAEDAKRCRDWNASVAHLFAGTANWIDQNTSFSDRVNSAFGAAADASPIWQGGKWVTSALSGLASTVVAAAKFIENPSSIADDWANSMKPAAIDFATNVLKGLSTGHFDVGSDWFLRLYGASVAIGFVVMAFMLVFAIQRGAKGAPPRELAESLFGYLPTAIFLAIFAPAFATLILEFTKALSTSLAEWGGTPAGELINHIGEFNGATSASFPGGSLMAVLMFGLLLLGAAVIWIGMMLHDYGLPIAGAVSGISIFMMVHPKYRHKALRPVFMFLGLAFSVPALFFVLAVIFTAANAIYEQDTSGMGEVAKIFQVAIAMILIGLAPWALLKWTPILPTASDSEDFGNGPSLVGDVVGSGGNALMYARMGGGEGVGGAAPASRTDVNINGGGGGGAAGAGGPGGNGPGASNGSPTAGEPNSALARTYREKGAASNDSNAVGSGVHPGVHAGGEAATAERAGSTAAKAGAGAASGGATIAAAVGVQAVSSAINKAKAVSDDAAPRADSDQ